MDRADLNINTAFQTIILNISKTFSLDLNKITILANDRMKFVQKDKPTSDIEINLNIIAPSFTRSVIYDENVLKLIKEVYDNIQNS